MKPGRRSGTGTGTGSGSGSGSGTESGGGGGNGGGGGGGNGRRKSTEGGNNNSSSGSASGASGSGSIKKNVKNPKDLNFFESLLFGPPIQEYQSIAAAEMSKVTSTHFFFGFFPYFLSFLVLILSQINLRVHLFINIIFICSNYIYFYNL